MQTFMPHQGYYRSALVLDNKRLGKQRVECKQILNALILPSAGWKNHPATRMWRGHEAALACYAIDICRAWRGRGFNDSLLPYFQSMYDLVLDRSNPGLPAWMGDPEFHYSHQSNLVRKDPNHYRQFYPDIPDDLPYVWPV